MKLRIRPSFYIEQDDAKPYPLERALALLREIDNTGNLRAACAAVGVSYRGAWDVLAGLEQLLGGAVVDMARGKGSTLTELGKRLVWAERLTHARFDPLLDSMAMEIDSEIQGVLNRVQRQLKIYASHGFAVAALNAHLEQIAVPVELSYRGSVEALRALHRGACDIAGFHVPVGEFEAAVFNQFRDLFKPSQVMINVATRRQGLMVRKGNPKNVWTVRDLLTPGIVLVNRQQGSGTRVILDLLLKREGESGQRVAGFESVELTHAAVAAYVASGKADVGLGVETAARQFDLDFVPLLTERYFFVCEKETLSDPRFGEVLAFLKTVQFKAEVSKLAGYDASTTGVVMDLKDAFPGMVG
ncbi:substrate-binding domain-containing protein [Massilia sp. GCM10023247]|uniref:substrate-binding domain-containing protein n=1 Tax=Massilia sp. GCM10023247 TaxID=3252643 RepID=UPI00360C5733